MLLEDLKSQINHGWRRSGDKHSVKEMTPSLLPPTLPLLNCFVKVEQLMAVTGVAKEIATNLLEACGGNLEMAVNMNI